MNLSNADQLRTVINREARSYRFSAVLVDYDAGARAGVVTSVVSGPVTQQSRPLPVSKTLQLMETVLVPGTVVIIEKVTGRTPVIVDTIDRMAGEHRPAPIAGQNVSLGNQVTTDLRIDPDTLVTGALSWQPGTVTFRGVSYTVPGGFSEARYLYWPEGGDYLEGSDAPPAPGDGRWLIGVNRDGAFTGMTSQLDGLGLVSGSVASYALASGAVGSFHLQPRSVTSGTVAVGGLITENYALRSVTSGVIGVNHVLNEHIGFRAVSSGEIALTALRSEHFSLGAVTSGAVADLHITTPKYANLSIVSGKLAANSITPEKLVTGAVTDTKTGFTRVDTHAGAGADDGVSALGTRPVKYLQMRGDDGQIYKVPGYL